VSRPPVRLPWPPHPTDVALFDGLYKLADLADVPKDRRHGFYRDLSTVIGYYLEIDLRHKVPSELKGEAFLEAEKAVRAAAVAFSKLSAEQETLLFAARHVHEGYLWTPSFLESFADGLHYPRWSGSRQWMLTKKRIVSCDGYDYVDDEGNFDDDGYHDDDEVELFGNYLAEIVEAFGRVTGNPTPDYDKSERMGAPKGPRKNWQLSQLVAHLFIIPWRHEGNLSFNDKDESKGRMPKALEILDSIFHFPSSLSLSAIALIRQRCVQLWEEADPSLRERTLPLTLI
jgi:hypothetical protein